MIQRANLRERALLQMEPQYNPLFNPSAVGGNVYVAESDYKNNGDIYCFGGDGKLFKKFEAGLNP